MSQSYVATQNYNSQTVNIMSSTNLIFAGLASPAETIVQFPLHERVGCRKMLRCWSDAAARDVHGVLPISGCGTLWLGHNSRCKLGSQRRSWQGLVQKGEGEQLLSVVKSITGTVVKFIVNYIVSCEVHNSTGGQGHVSCEVYRKSSFELYNISRVA